MATTFGPTFGDEVHAAGLGGLSFSWQLEGTILGRENLTAAQNKTLDDVIAAHDPTKGEWPPAIDPNSPAFRKS